jgi:hypothetical protein
MASGRVYALAPVLLHRVSRHCHDRQPIQRLQLADLARTAYQGAVRTHAPESMTASTAAAMRA